MSGEPNWCALPPFTTRGSTSPAPPSRTRVQFQLSSKNENGPELHGAILILGGGGGNRTRVLRSRGQGVYACISGFWSRVWELTRARSLRRQPIRVPAAAAGPVAAR